MTFDEAVEAELHAYLRRNPDTPRPLKDIRSNIRRRLRGLCEKCTKTAANGRLYCIDHLVNRRKLDKVKRKERKENHICTRCSKPLLADETTVECMDCQEYHTERRRFAVTY